LCESIQISSELIWKDKILSRQLFSKIGPNESHKVRLIVRPQSVGSDDKERKPTDPLTIRLTVANSTGKHLWTGIIGPYRIVVRVKDVNTKTKKDSYPIPFTRCYDDLQAESGFTNESITPKRLLDQTPPDETISRKRRRIDPLDTNSETILTRLERLEQLLLSSSQQSVTVNGSSDSILSEYPFDSSFLGETQSDFSSHNSFLEALLSLDCHDDILFPSGL